MTLTIEFPFSCYNYQCNNFAFVKVKSTCHLVVSAMDKILCLDNISSRLPSPSSALVNVIHGTHSDVKGPESVTTKQLDFDTKESRKGDLNEICG